MFKQKKCNIFLIGTSIFFADINKEQYSKGMTMDTAGKRAFKLRNVLGLMVVCQKIAKILFHKVA